MADDPRSVRAETLRSILDRSPDYLRISIRAALIAALLGAAGSGITAVWPHAATRPSFFLLVWALLGGAGAFCVLYLLASAATRRSEPFLSPGFKLAAACLVPPVLASLAVLFLISRTGMPPNLLATVLSLLYGTCLLSAAAFAPRPIRKLGWSFLLVGTAALMALIVVYRVQPDTAGSFPAWIVTAVTFFLLHAIHPFSAVAAKPATKAD